MMLYQTGDVIMCISTTIYVPTYDGAMVGLTSALNCYHIMLLFRYVARLLSWMVDWLPFVKRNLLHSVRYYAVLEVKNLHRNIRT